MGKIKKILENELVGGTQTTDVYPVTSIKAVYDENNERLDGIINRKGVVNISTNYNIEHIAEVLTLSQALSKVPSTNRVLGFQGKYLASDGWHTIIYTGDNLTDWSDKTKWIDLVDKIFNSISNNATFAGIATPTTDPETPDGPVFYIANGKGTYTKFGGLEVTEEDVVVLYYDTAWHKLLTGIASQAKLSELGEQKSEAMLNLLNQDSCLPNTAFSDKNNGVTKDSNGWSLTDYIMLEPNTSYFIYGCYLPNFYCFYDSDKNIISSPNVEITYSSDQYKGIINVGDEKVYFRGSWLNGKTNPYVSQYIDKYIPYGEKDYSYLSPKLNEDIKNLKKDNKETLNLNLFDVTKITDNTSIVNNGTTKESSGWALSDFIKLKGNTTYYSFGFYLETFFAVYTLDKVVTSASKVTLQYEGTNKVLGTITVGSEDVFVRMSWLKSNANPYISQYINAYRPFGTSDYSFVSPYLLKSNSIADKKVAIIGDSISAYNYAYYNKWTQALQNEGFFPQDMTNSSIHATGFVTDGSYAGGTRTGDNFPTRLKAIETPNIYDYAIIFGGVNDYIQAVPIADFTTAVNDFFEYLVKNFINASIMVVLPLYRANHGANAIGKTEDDYIAIIKNTAKTYHLPILNATDESGFYADVDEFKTRWTNQGDGLHPNEEWSRTRLAPYIRTFIESHLKY